MNIYDKSAAQGRTVYFDNDTRPLPHPTTFQKKEEKRKEKEDILKKDFGRHEKKDKHLSLSDYRYFLILKNNILNVMYR